ncbi:hypothetical protein VN97_g2650 [Penicillium thymicola]|uniref:Uncharacterized protein n=1 Tax=Penicillium thymicola TaxID=293382 RepID=A0AAI9TQ35_PENTH|nr:hypothetical protein VN97_g2650 [Penicillium thymicola]
MPKWPLYCQQLVFAGRGRRSANRDRQMMSLLCGCLGSFASLGNDLGNCFALHVVPSVELFLPLDFGRSSRHSFSATHLGHPLFFLRRTISSLE